MSDGVAEPGQRVGRLAALRAFGRGGKKATRDPRRNEAGEEGGDERCALCGVLVAEAHPHLVEIAARRMLCACAACAILFDSATARLRRVPDRVERLPGLRIGDALWSALGIPIGVAFFLRSSIDGRVTALYPSPAGAVESLPPDAAFAELVAGDERLASLLPDVEALLVHRLGSPHRAYRAPVDACYRLVGLVRAHWRGLSGGEALWREVDGFFAGLELRADA